MNNVLKGIVDQLNSSGIDFDCIGEEIIINISEARETIVTVRPSRFGEPSVYIQGESGKFYLLEMNRKDIKEEKILQNDMEREINAMKVKEE